MPLKAMQKDSTYDKEWRLRIECLQGSQYIILPAMH